MIISRCHAVLKAKLAMQKSAALRAAASTRDTGMVELLLSAGAEINGANPKVMLQTSNAPH